MRAILVLAAGRSSDGPVFNMALAAARVLGAHLEFLHAHVDDAAAHSATALHHFEELCERDAITIAIGPSTHTTSAIPASWHDERHAGIGALIHCARHNDLVVVGRPTRHNGLPPDLIERLLAESGRPVLLASAIERTRLTGTALVCWKETADAARALSAALPLLAHSKRVVIVSVEEGRGSPRNLDHLAQRLEWDGILADVRWLRANADPVEHRLEAVAGEVVADLIVMGGHGPGRLREMMFGGCTRHFLDGGERPVLMMH